MYKISLFLSLFEFANTLQAIHNTKDTFPFEGPIFPKSFFNLNKGSKVSNYAFENFDVNHKSAPKFLMHQTSSAQKREKKNFDLRSIDGQNTLKNRKFGDKVSSLVLSKQNITEIIPNKSVEPEGKRHKKKTSNYYQETDDLHPEDKPREYLPFLGQIDEDIDPGNNKES